MIIFLFLARLDYQFDLNGNHEYPKLYLDMHVTIFSIPIWFKTKKATNYFMSFKPDEDTNDNVFSVWRNGTDFFVEPLRGKM